MFKSEKNENQIEVIINRLYKSYNSSAKKYNYSFSLPELNVRGLPTILFLGDHSSGKSSFINFLLGNIEVQDTGITPTDDGFTVILYGENNEDFFGPSALDHLSAEFSALGKFAPDFLQNLRVKFRNCEFLKKVNLIDSPGMVDIAGDRNLRGYNFSEVVRNFVEISNLVFFMFDPEKPGTTSESAEILSKCMFGMEFKLRILLNKCDTFENMYDFSRAYGALCWNLSRIIKSKDSPKIYTTFTPNEKTKASSKIDLTWFNNHNLELQSIIETAEDRKIDNIMASVFADFTKFYIRVAVIQKASKKLFQSLLCGIGITSLFALILFLLEAWAYNSISDQSFYGPITVGRFFFWLIAVLTVSSCVFFGIKFVRMIQEMTRLKMVNNTDKLFEECFDESPSYGGRQNLHQYWVAIKPDTSSIIKNAKRLPCFSWWLKHKLEQIVCVQLKGIMDMLRKKSTN